MKDEVIELSLGVDWVGTVVEANVEGVARRGVPDSKPPTKGLLRR
jgi:hypothetical protein